MKKVSNEELIKVSQFINAVDDMINGKFILADTKILNILDIINSSHDMSHYISECMIDFDYTKEFGRAEIKNSFNKGEYKCPEIPEKIVALVFCMLKDFSVKKIDFYNFIKTNFGDAGESGQYTAFAQTLLIPFKNLIVEHYNIKDNKVVLNDEEEDERIVKENIAPGVFEEMHVVICQMEEIIKVDKHVRGDLKEDLLYILSSSNYSLKYKDIKLIGALLTAFEKMSTKIQSIKYLKNDLKQLILKYYEQAKKEN